MARKRKPDGLPDDPLKQASASTAVAKITGTEKAIRKPRKDATGRKSDYHHASEPLAVRAPAEIAEQIRAAAEARGITVNAWLLEAIQAKLRGL